MPQKGGHSDSVARANDSPELRTVLPRASSRVLAGDDFLFCLGGLVFASLIQVTSGMLSALCASASVLFGPLGLWPLALQPALREGMPRCGGPPLGDLDAEP